MKDNELVYTPYSRILNGYLIHLKNGKKAGGVF